MALKRLYKEISDLQAEPVGIPGCKFEQDRDPFKLHVSFDIDGATLDGVIFTMEFPSDYPFSPPKIYTENPNYRHIFISVPPHQWGTFITVRWLIWHIYLSITDRDCYEGDKSQRSTVHHMQ